MEELLVIVVCLLLNAALSAFEMAFVSIPRSELHKRTKSEGRDSEQAKWILTQRENPERVLSTIQVGITLVGALAAAVGGVGAAKSLRPFLIGEFGFTQTFAEVVSLLVVVLPLTYLSVVLGELVPKSLALRHPLVILLRGARWLAIADRILDPVVNFLEKSTKVVLQFSIRRLRQGAHARSGSGDRNEEGHPMSASSSLNRESLDGSLIEIDTLTPLHQRYMLNLATIERKLIRNMMIPWAQVNCVRLEDSLGEVAQIVFSSAHTRLPVVDNGKVAGILHTKEFLAYRESGALDWSSIIRPALRVKETDTALFVLKLMQEKRSHMAIIYSVDSVRIGMVTLEDIHEEIWGDMYDEDDDGRIRKILASGYRRKLP